jgi:beta-glucanase (GH16 family)
VTIRVIAVIVLAALLGTACAAAEDSARVGHAEVGRSAPAGWRLVFSDDFNHGALNRRIWRTCFWWASRTCSITSNDELQLYNGGNVSVSRGILSLRARKQRMVGWNGRTYRYTSGMVMTGGRKYHARPGFAFTYGKVEARVKVPKGHGLWPAFWMLPTSYESRPEIDAMEILGGSTNVQRMHFHYLTPGGTKASAGQNWVGPDFAAGWHTFAVDWEPDAIVWYVDGIERWRFTDPAVIPKHPMYLVLSLAVGGSFPGPPRRSTTLPSYLSVDYVRVSQHTPAPG